MCRANHLRTTNIQELSSCLSHALSQNAKSSIVMRATAAAHWIQASFVSSSAFVLCSANLAKQDRLPLLFRSINLNHGSQSALWLPRQCSFATSWRLLRLAQQARRHPRHNTSSTCLCLHVHPFCLPICTASCSCHSQSQGAAPSQAHVQGGPLRREESRRPGTIPKGLTPQRSCGPSACCLRAGDALGACILRPHKQGHAVQELRVAELVHWRGRTRVHAD